MEFMPAKECASYGSAPAQVVRINFEGADRTKDSAIKTETQELLKVKTFNELVTKAFEMKLRMEKSGMFENVVVLIDVDRSENPAKDRFEVLFVAKEPSMRKTFFGTNASNRGEGSLTVDTKSFSIFGAAQTVAVPLSQGNECTSTFEIGLQKPLLKWRSARFDFNLYRIVADYPWSGFLQTENCAGLEIKYEPFRKIIHQLKYNASWRRIDITTRAVSSIRDHAGHAIKSSLQSILSYDTQDDAILASKGILTRLSTEIAGFGGDAKFDRHDLDVKISTTLPLNIILSLVGQLSYVRPRAGPSLSIVDRTFFGGTVNLRGFQYNDIGPVSDNGYLGGTSSLCGAAHLYRRLWPTFLYVHGFAMVDNIYPVSPTSRFADILREVTAAPRFSVGGGILVKLGQRARLEFNYCLPLKSYTTDYTKQGFQFGIGVNSI